ncbi:hypothetical protein N9980_00290, partial [bacterium]|nr:hypothetical protein [bacterium]
DGLILVVENKLFGANSTGQLLDQLLGIEDKYSRTRVREYVYLTLVGEQPSSDLADEKQILPRWVALGWLIHILPIIDHLEPNPEGRLRELSVLLRWLSSLSIQAESESNTVDQFVEAILDGVAICVLAELNRLSRSGRWKQSTTGSHRLRLVHTAAPKRYLSLNLLTDCSIAIQSKYKGKPRCDKLLLPVGAPARQFFNLMHISARDLYWIHFGKPMAYLKNTHRKTKQTEIERSFAPMLDFIAKHRFELQALLGVHGCKKNKRGS